MTRERQVKVSAKNETVTLTGSEVIQFSNAIEFALGNNPTASVQDDLAWLLGWQLGQLREPLREVQDALKDTRIRKMEAAARESTAENPFIESKWMEAIGMRDAAMQKRYAIEIGEPKREWFSGETMLAFSKVLSFMKIDK